jgi:hypothetical protein
MCVLMMVITNDITGGNQNNEADKKPCLNAV